MSLRRSSIPPPATSPTSKSSTHAVTVALHRPLELKADVYVTTRYLREYASGMGTAGGLYFFRDILLEGAPSQIYVLHADIACDFPLEELKKFHDSHRGVGTIMGVKVEREEATKFGCIVMNQESKKAIHYVEKPESYISDIINGGVYLFSASIFDEIKLAKDAHTKRTSEDPTSGQVRLSLSNPLSLSLTLVRRRSRNYDWNKTFSPLSPPPESSSSTKRRSNGFKSSPPLPQSPPTPSSSPRTKRPIPLSSDVDLPPSSKRPRSSRKPPDRKSSNRVSSTRLRNCIRRRRLDRTSRLVRMSRLEKDVECGIRLSLSERCWRRILARFTLLFRRTASLVPGRVSRELLCKPERRSNPSASSVRLSLSSPRFETYGDSRCSQERSSDEGGQCQVVHRAAVQGPQQEFEKSSPALVAYSYLGLECHSSVSRINLCELRVRFASHSRRKSRMHLSFLADAFLSFLHASAPNHSAASPHATLTPLRDTQLERREGMSSVQLYAYDLSNGLASQFGVALTGRPIEGIWHTAVVVHGQEIYFGQGIAFSTPGRTHHGAPKKIIDLGTTTITKPALLAHVESLRSKWTANAYHLLENNCNHFSNTLVKYLNGGSIPREILYQPQELMGTEFGRSLRPMIDNMFRGAGGNGVEADQAVEAIVDRAIPSLVTSPRQFSCLPFVPSDIDGFL